MRGKYRANESQGNFEKHVGFLAAYHARREAPGYPLYSSWREARHCGVSLLSLAESPSKVHHTPFIQRNLKAYSIREHRVTKIIKIFAFSLRLSASAVKTNGKVIMLKIDTLLLA
jgi:hypothetical protein